MDGVLFAIAKRRPAVLKMHLVQYLIVYLAQMKTMAFLYSPVRLDFQDCISVHFALLTDWEEVCRPLILWTLCILHKVVVKSDCLVSNGDASVFAKS